MCVQCMIGAMGATAGASGMRSYVAARHFSWMTPKRMRAMTIALAIAAVLGSATLGGATPGHSGQRPDHAATAHSAPGR